MTFATRITSLAVAATLLAVPCLGAQAVAPGAGQAATPKPERRTVVTMNPFAIVALYLTGDIETKVAPALTIGVGGSVAGGSDSDAGGEDFNAYRALDAKLRYYPSERALYGFSVAATVGLVSGRAEVYDGSFEPTLGERVTRATFGTDLSYQWLLGPKDRFATVLGFGFKRLLGNDQSTNALDFTFLPTARVNIGFAF